MDRHRKHVNLFVADSPTGAMCSSVIHEWAKGKYDSVTVKYLKDENDIDEELMRLYDLIKMAEQEHGNPCSTREIIVVGMFPCSQALKRFDSLKGVHITLFGEIIESYAERTRRLMKRYLGFFKRKWPHGYVELYHALKEYDYTGWRRVLSTFVSNRGSEELEMLISAYIHDLKPKQEFNVFDMVDYYYAVFLRRNKNDSNQTERV